MAIQKLVGTDTIGDTPCGGGTHRLGKFVATKSGIASELRLYSTQNGNVKVNFYDDDGSEQGAPNSLLWSNDSSQGATGSQWNTYTVTDTVLIAGQTYWVGGNGNVSGALSFSTVSDEHTHLKSAVWGSFSAPDPAGTGFTDVNNQLSAFSLYGQADPEVTDIDGDDTFFDHDTDIVATGTDYGAAQGSGKLELANDADYDLATTVVEQFVNSWSDTEIDFDVKSGDIGAGTVYAFVTTDAGQRNLVGFSATLVIEILTGTGIGTGLPVPNGYWPYNGVSRGVSRGVISHGIRTSEGVANSRMLTTVPGIDNISPIIDFPAASAVTPVFRYKGGDADGTSFPPWGYGTTLPFVSDGTAPTYNHGSPLWGSSNDDSVKYNEGSYHQDADNFTVVTTGDIYFEALVQTGLSAGLTYLVLNRETIGFMFYEKTNGNFYFQINDGTNSREVQMSSGQHGVVYVAAYVDRSEASIYGGAGSYNGLIYDQVDLSATTGTLAGSKLTIGAFPVGIANAATTLMYTGMWYASELWSGGAANEADYAALQKERFYKIAGAYPSLAADNDVTFVRDDHGYLQAPSDIASATDSTKRLWYMGDGWPRVGSTVDSSAVASRGYLSESETEQLSDQWQADDWTLLDGTDTETADDLLAPDRSQTMTTLIPSTTSGLHGWNKSITLTAETYVISAYGYDANSKWLRLEDDTVANCYATFDLSDGSIYETGAGCTSHISAEDYECDGDNKGYRCSIKLTGTVAAHDIRVKLQGGTVTPSDTFAGDGATKYIGVWAMQVEQGELATSPIITEGATATRDGDVLYYVGNGNIGGPDVREGLIQSTIHLPDHDAEVDKTALVLTDSSSAVDFVEEELKSTDVLNANSDSTEGNVGLSTSGVDVTDNDRHKTTINWRTDRLQIGVDSIAGSVDLDCTMPDSINRIYVGCDSSGANQLNGYISNLTFSSDGTNPSAIIQTTETGSTTVTLRGQTGHSVFINWGDGTVEEIDLLGTGTNVNAVHDYQSLAGTKDIKLYDGLGSLTRFIAAANTDYTGSLDQVVNMINLTYLNVRTTSFSSSLKPLVEGLTVMSTLVAYETSLSYEASTLSSALVSISCYDNGWSAAEVDQIIIDVDTAGASGGTLSIAGDNAARTAASDAALASIVGDGWTVTVNE